MDKLLTINQAADLIGVHPETLRRWDREEKLVAVKINDRGDRRYKEDEIWGFINANPKLIKYNKSTDHAGYSIEWYSEGFLSMPGNFGVIAKITAKKDNEFIGFAFAVSGMSMFARIEIKDDLDKLALDKVKEYIDKKSLSDEDIYTFEFNNGEFHEVQNPEWWGGKYSKSLVPGLRIEAHTTHPVTVKNQAWRVILQFKSKEGDIWVTNTFGPNHSFHEYYTWIDSNELLSKGLSNTAKSAEILAINFGIERFEETKNNDGDRDITGITENNAAYYSGKWVKNSLLPDKLMS